MTRRYTTETGRLRVVDPEGAALEEALERLVEGLGAAAVAAQDVAGAPPLGVRAVEVAPGRMRYLCAFEGPAFLCLSERHDPVTSARAVRETATAGLAWEHVEAMVDTGRLQELAAAAGRVLAHADEPADMVAAVGGVVEAVRTLAVWRDSPLRACASIPQLDVASSLQDHAYRAYAMFVAASDHLVGMQDTLGAPLVSSLRGFEEAAVAAGVVERLADTMGRLVASCDEAAGEMVAAHVTRLGE